MSMLKVMAKQYDAPRAKATVQARVDPDALDRLDSLAAKVGRSRSELLNFAAIEWSRLDPEEAEKRIRAVFKTAR